MSLIAVSLQFCLLLYLEFLRFPILKDYPKQIYECTKQCLVIGGFIDSDFVDIRSLLFFSAQFSHRTSQLDLNVSLSLLSYGEMEEFKTIAESINGSQEKH